VARQFDNDADFRKSGEGRPVEFSTLSVQSLRKRAVQPVSKCDPVLPAPPVAKAGSLNKFIPPVFEKLNFSIQEFAGHFSP
jgi:hypothetical protein